MRLVLAVFLISMVGVSAAECIPTPGRTIGTHYDLAKAKPRPNPLGQGFVISGRVLASPGCRPLPKVKITYWQAGANGAYADRFYVERHTDEAGAYRFETEWPAIHPPHVHFLVEVPGYEALATQWVGGKRVPSATFDLVLQPK